MLSVAGSRTAPERVGLALAGLKRGCRRVGGSRTRCTLLDSAAGSGLLETLAD